MCENSKDGNSKNQFSSNNCNEEETQSIISYDDAIIDNLDQTSVSSRKLRENSQNNCENFYDIKNIF